MYIIHWVDYFYAYHFKCISHKEVAKTTPFQEE